MNKLGPIIASVGFIMIFVSRTLNSVHGHTAARLQSNGNLAVWMSQISKGLRECYIMTLSTTHWVPVQVKGSKILCGKLETMKITPSDCPGQEYLTINLGSTRDWRQLKLPLVRLSGGWKGRYWLAGAAWGRECRRRSSVLLLNLSDTAATSQDGSSLKCIAAIAGRQCYIQDASGRGLCAQRPLEAWSFYWLP